MSEKEQSMPAVELIDEQTTFTLVELCRSCAVEAEFIEAMVEQGILEPSGKHGRHWCFPSSSLRRTRITLHLQRDLGVNLAGVEVILRMSQQIAQLQKATEELEAESARLRREKE